MDEINTELDTDILDEQLTEAVRRLERRREEVLALAFLAGYDGIDIINEDRVATRYEDFRAGFKWEGWHGEPPQRDQWGQPFQRYDFRGLLEREQEMLTAVVGAELADREIYE
jgi:hypothetical protein